MKTSTFFLFTLVIFVGLLSNTLAIQWSKNFKQADINTLTPIVEGMQNSLSKQNYGAIWKTLGDKGSKKLVDNVLGGTKVINNKQEFIDAFAKYKQFGQLKFNIKSANLKSASSDAFYHFTMDGSITSNFPVGITFNANVFFFGKGPVEGQVKSVVFTIAFA